MFATRIGLVVLSFLIQGMLAYMLLSEGRGSYAVCVMFGTLLDTLAISTPLGRLLLSEVFPPATLLLWIMALGIPALAVSRIFMTYFKGVDRPDICLAADLVTPTQRRGFPVGGR